MSATTEQPIEGAKYWIPVTSIKIAVKVPIASVLSPDNPNGALFEQGKVAFYPVVLDKIEGVRTLDCTID